MGRFAVVGCPSCRRLWGIETRFKRVKCPNCGATHEVSLVKRLWEGDDARAVPAVIAEIGNRERDQQ